MLARTIGKVSRGTSLVLPEHRFSIASPMPSRLLNYLNIMPSRLANPLFVAFHDRSDDLTLKAPIFFKFRGSIIINISQAYVNL